MIQANELRIGNKVYYNGMIVTIQQILSDSVMAYSIADMPDDEYSFSEINPIPLSPEILEKCGFHWSIYHQAFHFGDTAMNEFYDLNECYPKGYQLSTFKKSQLIGKGIFYLHQLQNIYFALTGEELPYTP